VVPHIATTRAEIGKLDMGGIAMVCISCLEISGSVSHLRYLVLRLRWRLPPDVPILVGLWPDEADAAQDERLRAAVGADYYSRSLHEAVETCLQSAAKASVNAQPPLSMETAAVAH
jgi:hypothetical protein